MSDPQSPPQHYRLLWVLAAVTALIVALILIRQPGLLAGGDLASSQRATESSVRDYIMANPEIVQDALEELRRREMADRDRAAKQQIAANRQELFFDSGSVVGGDPEGDVTVVEFFDYNCTYCRQSHEATKKLQQKEGVRFVFKEFPILGPGSVVAARAALASVHQGTDEYIAFHNALMEYPSSVDEQAVMAVAEEVGLDVSQLQFDMRSPQIDKIIDANMALAQKVGVNGTPTFIVEDNLVGGAAQYEYLAHLVQEARKEKEAKDS